jgi:hypothetical protein
VLLPFLEKRKFVLIIGDDGAILVLLNKHNVEKRLFAPSSSIVDRREIASLITKYPTVPIYVMLDNMEQSYTKQTLPAVSSMAIGGLVQKRLDRDFAASDIKGAILLGRDLEGRRDWIYMFASAPLTPSISEWIEYISSLENKFTGIYMLPVEMENFVRKLHKTAVKEKKEEASWKLIVTYNKTSGFRQVVLQNDKVIFTRLIRPGKDMQSDIVAGNIEQEVLNTIDYMRRLSFGDDEKIEIIGVLSADLKKSLSGTKIRGNPIELYTPFEAANLIGLKNVVEENDKYADLVIAANFINSKAILKLENEINKKANLLIALGTVASMAVVAIVPILVFYSLYSIYLIITISEKVQDLENDKAQIEKKWKDARQTDDYNIDEANKLTDVYTLHKKLKNSISPLDLISKTSIAQKDFALTKSLNWNFEKAASANGAPETGDPKYVEKAIFNLEFSKVGEGPEELFKNFDEFKAVLKKQLEGYKMDITELPSTINFDDKNKLITTQLKIEPAQEEKK